MEMIKCPECGSYNLLSLRNGEIVRCQDCKKTVKGKEILEVWKRIDKDVDTFFKENYG